MSKAQLRCLWAKAGECKSSEATPFKAECTRWISTVALWRRWPRSQSVLQCSAMRCNSWQCTTMQNRMRAKLPLQFSAICVLVLWTVFYIFPVLVQISGTKNVYEWVLESMKSRFEPTKFKDNIMPNTMATLPGPSLVTKRPNMIENKNLKLYMFVDVGQP